MKFEELTKENICDKLREIWELRCKYMNPSNETDELIHKEVEELVLQYTRQILAIDDHFEHRTLVEVIKESTEDMSQLKCDERAILYKENGYYFCFYYKNLETNEIYYSLAEVEKKVGSYYLITYNSNSIAHYYYCEELDILLCNQYFLLEDEGTPRYVRSEHVFVFTRDKTKYIIEFSFNNEYLGLSSERYYMPTNGNFEGEKTNQSLIREFTKMFKQPIMNIGANKFITIDTAQALSDFLDYNAKLEIKSGPKQKKIDDLTSIALPAIKTEVPSSFRGATASTPYSKTSVQRVKENTCVVRWKLCRKAGDYECDGLRIYIEGKDIHPCKLNNNNKFVRTTISNLKPENFLSCDMDEINKSDLEGTMLEYYGEIINDIPSQYRSLLLILFIKDPKVEQLFKMGLNKLIIRALEKGEYDVSKYVCKVLRIECDKNEKNIFKYIGVNKYQFASYKNILENHEALGYKLDIACSLIANMKRIFDEELASIDNKTYDEVSAAILKYDTDRANSYVHHTFHRSVEIGRIKNLIQRTGNKNLIKHFKELIVPLCGINHSTFRNYSDYIDMVIRLDDFKNFKIGFSNETDILAMHEAVVSVYNLNAEKYKTAEFKKQLKKIEGLEYENDDFDFVVVLPKVPGDLAKEGLELHHCVKSYIDKICRGTTNIVFIRKKEDVTKPFFTVEVSNEKTIEQVHGFSNRIASTEPNLEEFVKRWAKNKRLKINDINKIR